MAVHAGLHRDETAGLAHTGRENVAAHAGEMPVDSSGSPGPDEYGLPPVDVEIPDDARELDRDVHAYYRELRAGRRRGPARRFRSPVTRGGLLLPLLAACLALTLLAGALLAVFTAGQGPFFLPSRAPSSGGGGQPAPGPAGGRLPNANVLVGGEETPLRSLTAAVLAVVPPGCRCERAVAQVTHEAQRAGASAYVVGIDHVQVTALAGQVGLRAGHAVEDPTNVLVTYYHPSGLTAILVSGSGIVTNVIGVRGHAAEVQKAIRALPDARSQGLGAVTRTPPGLPLAAAPGR